MKDQLPKQLKKARGKQLGMLEDELRHAYFTSLIDQSSKYSLTQIVITRVRWSVRCHAPVQFTGEESMIGTLVKVVAERVQGPYRREIGRLSHVLRPRQITAPRTTGNMHCRG